MNDKVDEKEIEKKEETFENMKEKTSILKIIWNIIFWGIIIILAFVWIFDFIQVKNNKEPKFCISNKIHEFEDGTEIGTGTY